MSDQVKLTDDSCGCDSCGCHGQEAGAVQYGTVIEDYAVAVQNLGSNLPALASSTLPISEVVRNRLLDAGAKFFCNDNISAFITDEERALLVDEVTTKMEGVLRSLIIDIDHDHNTNDTARRVAKMWVNEVYGGRFAPAPKITSFPNVGYDDMYVSGPITIRSTCAHHFQNIVGRAWVGILPENEVIGLSKFNRIVEWIASRPQIQEEMTTQIADALVEYAKTPNIAVVVKAEHHCMTHRGVKEHESDMTTAVMRGKFRENASLKQEFYAIMSKMKGHE